MAEHNKLRLVYAGTPDFAATILGALLSTRHEVLAVYTQPDRPAGRGRKLRSSPVKSCALKHGLTVLQPNRFDQHFVTELAALRADVMVVAAYGLLLPAGVLQAPRFGCINVHASLLPRWRGAAPIQRAILAGDVETGITIMQMDEGLDTGDILETRSLAIGDDDTASTLHERLAAIGGQALMSVLEQLARSELKPVAQDETRSTYARRLSTLR